MAMRREHRLVIDRIACTGHGLCAELFPEHLSLDEWGYPIQAPGPISAGELRHARRAIAACPALALRLETGRPRHPAPTAAPDPEQTAEITKIFES
jgi:ferredoxin